MKTSIRMSIMASLASIANLPETATLANRRYAKPIYSNGGQSYTRGKRHRSQRARANRRKARRVR